MSMASLTSSTVPSPSLSIGSAQSADSGCFVNHGGAEKKEVTIAEGGITSVVGGGVENLVDGSTPQNDASEDDENADKDSALPAALDAAIISGLLRESCRHGHLHVVRWLCETCHFTKPQLIDTMALHASCQSGHFFIAQWLCEEYNISAEDLDKVNLQMSDTSMSVEDKPPADVSEQTIGDSEAAAREWLRERLGLQDWVFV